MPKEASTSLDYSTFQRKRSDIDIMADILKEAKKVTRKTHIMYNCNLSYGQLENYLSFLLDIGLLDCYSDESSNCQCFRTTSKGSKYLNVYCKLKILMS
jgi:predicted transcriptional regulator